MNHKKYYLIQKNKTMYFEVPDDYPEGKIPKFLNLKDFNTWCSQQGFIKKSEEAEDNELVYRYSVNDIKTMNFIPLLNDLERYQHLIEGDGFPESVALSLSPEGYFRELYKSILPMEVYEKFKVKLMKKIPNQEFSKIIDELIENDEFFSLNDTSETFIEFLNKEKVLLESFNFYDLSFSDPGAFEEKEDWDESSMPPFSPRKVELLLSMCQKIVNKDQFEYIKRDLLSIIESNQLEKLGIILKHGELPKLLIKEFLKENEEMSVELKSMFIDSLS